jgi:hypothetical protein
VWLVLCVMGSVVYALCVMCSLVCAPWVLCSVVVCDVGDVLSGCMYYMVRARGLYVRRVMCSVVHALCVMCSVVTILCVMNDPPVKGRVRGESPR